MIKLTVDNISVEVAEKSTILDAAQHANIHIPTMCHLKGTEHFTSCMICLVKDTKSGKLLPSCSVPATDGMSIVTNDTECKESRKVALELLLSEHVGDCEAPCQVFCPAHMNIPLMNRLIAKGDFKKAVEVVERDIAFPAILGRICTAPCEAGCRRKTVDNAVSICHLKGFTADHKTKKIIAPLTGKSVAIIGGGVAGLSAAFHLRLNGHNVTIYEKESKLGGQLSLIDSELLPKNIVDKEIEDILDLGIAVKLNTEIDNSTFASLSLKSENDIVILASGNSVEQLSNWGIATGKFGAEIDKTTFQTSVTNVFAIGNAVRKSKLAVKSVGQGKDAAKLINDLLASGELHPAEDRFNSKFGKLNADEFSEYLKEAEGTTEIANTKIELTSEEAVIEAARCLHCDCRNIESCKLRSLSDEYDAKQKRYQYDERQLVEKQFISKGVVYEQSKCIKCGICVRLTEINRESLGLTFIGRGFDVKVGVPLNDNLENGLQKTALLVARECPTGALSICDTEEQL